VHWRATNLCLAHTRSHGFGGSVVLGARASEEAPFNSPAGWASVVSQACSEWRAPPFSVILENIGNFTSYWVVQKVLISASVPGSWARKSLLEKPSNTTLPAKSPRFLLLPSISVSEKSWSVILVAPRSRALPARRCPVEVQREAPCLT
jgi:hypothetical protein